MDDRSIPEAVVLVADQLAPTAAVRTALDRWRRGGLKLAVVVTRPDQRASLAADDLGPLDAVIDPTDDPVPAAAQALGIDPSRCVAAHGDLARLRFLRRIPRLDAQLKLLGAGRPLALFLDFDGTLSPIVADPDAATISPEVRGTVAHLAEQHPVAIVSGRDRTDVERRVGLTGLWYAGSHGLDIAGPGGALAHPEAEAAAHAVAEATAQLERTLDGIAGAVLERKRFSVAAHYRMVDPHQADTVRDAAITAAAADPRLRVRTGKKVVEILPAIDWDKGRALDWLLQAMNIDPARTCVLYLGDDETDEDAFAALTGRGYGVHVGEEISDSLADYSLPDPAAVAALLRDLVTGA